MPLYTYICCHCNGQASYIREYERRNDVPLCCVCGFPMERAGTELFAIGARAIPQVQSDGLASSAGRGVDLNLNNVQIIGGDTAILATGARIRGQNIYLQGNKTGLQAHDSDIIIDNLTIE